MVTLVLSGCAGDAHRSLFPDFSRPASPVQETVGLAPSETVEGDLDLEEIEPHMCLDEELTALSRTGIWNKESSPVSVQPPSDIAYDFPVVMNKQVEMYLNLFQTKQRRQFGRWLAKSGYYREMVERELEAAGLPKDLLYLSMIESGFNQVAYSRARAVGLWQFMKGTGRQYNLRIDKYVDERRDALKSTKAAVAYLGDLYREFGDWHLAVAAYNGGPGKIRGGLKKYKVNNFWDLASKRYLRLETKRYVPKLIATLLIARQPEKYGFFGISFKDPLRYDTISVGPGLSLDAIALISGSNSKTIKKLNLELRQRKTPPNRGRYTINIPYGTEALAKKNISRLHSIVSTGYKTHKISKGESLSKICSRYGINKTTLLKVNNIRSGKLVAGTNLRIPYSTVTYQLLPKGSGAMAAYRDSLVLHRIRPGDTVSGIAKQYNVPPAMIVAWNGLQSAHAIRAGQQLALYIHQSKPPVPAADKSDTIKTPVIAAASVLQANRIKRKPSAGDSSFQWYSVKNGDSLWTISRKFSASTDDIKKWNNLKSNLIHPGIRLKLKKV